MSALRAARLASLWQRLRRYRLPAAPRRLRATKAGRLVVGMALLMGFAAINTGNNPLYFVWGAILGGIVVSGMLSEATLRPLQVTTTFAEELRVGETSQLALLLSNGSRWLPAFAVLWWVSLRDGLGQQRLRAPYQLRLEAGGALRAWLGFVPRTRGALGVAAVSAETAYPFGLFVKERPFAAPGRSAFVQPRKLPVGHLLLALRAHVQGEGRARAASGDEFWALRPYRQGESWRRVQWRRAAATGRWLVSEYEGEQAQSIILCLRLSQADAPDLQDVAHAALQEDTIALVASLAEALLADGMAVGLLSHGIAIAAATGHTHRRSLLDACARLTPQAALPQLPRLHGPQLWLQGLAATAEPGQPHLQLRLAESPAEAAWA